MATWLVTGGCGFIGSHLVEALLARGDRVRVLDDLSSGRRENLPSGAHLQVGDVADEATVTDLLESVNGCFHLAAVASVERCREEWLATHRTNLTGTITVLDAARRVASRQALPVVYASSAAVYGDNEDLPLNENARTRPLSAYGADKLGSEVHAQIAWSVHGVPNVGLRFFNVYGPRQDPSSPYSGVVAIFANRIAHGRDIEIFGDGEQTRDFIFVSDVVAYLLAAMADLRSGARVFNVCTGRGISILQLAHIIAEIIGRSVVIRHRPERCGDIKASVGDPSTARVTFGLSPKTEAIEGLRRTIDSIDAVTPLSSRCKSTSKFRASGSTLPGSRSRSDRDGNVSDGRPACGTVRRGRRVGP